MICIINFGSTKSKNIGECLDFLGYSFEIVDWQDLKNMDWKIIDGVILSGAPVLLTEVDTKIYLRQFEFLKNCRIPILGICFGHQLLGLLFGARVFKFEPVRKEIEITVLEKSLLFDGFDGIVKMQEDHTEGITLPEKFINLARSEKYDVEAMKHANYNVFGVQFHPEVSGKNGIELLNNFCKLTLLK